MAHFSHPGRRLVLRRRNVCRPISASKTSEHSLVLVAVAFALAGAVKGASGLGLPTVAIGFSAWLCRQQQRRLYWWFPRLQRIWCNAWGAATPAPWSRDWAALGSGLRWRLLRPVARPCRGQQRGPAAFAGLYAGSLLRGHMDATVFRRVLFASFVALGGAMVIKELV